MITYYLIIDFFLPEVVSYYIQKQKVTNFTQCIFFSYLNNNEDQIMREKESYLVEFQSSKILIITLIKLWETYFMASMTVKK